MDNARDVASYAVSDIRDRHHPSDSPDLSSDPIDLSLPAPRLPPRIQAILGDATRPSTGDDKHGHRPAFLRTASAPIIPNSPAYSPIHFDAESYSFTSARIQDEVIDQLQRTAYEQADEPYPCAASTPSIDREQDSTLDGDPEYVMVSKVLDIMSSNTAEAVGGIHIAVIGAGGVGKSTFMKNALGLGDLPALPMASLRLLVDHIPYTVTLIELDLDAFDVDPDRSITWPKQMNGQIVPVLDGALLLYDVTSSDSIVHLPQTLHALAVSALPTILVASKCDSPLTERQIDTDSIEAACLSEVQALKTASNVPESAKLCLGAMLRSIMTVRQSTSRRPSGVRESVTSMPGSNLELQHDYSQADGDVNTHFGQTSELHIMKSLPPTPKNTFSALPPPTHVPTISVLAHTNSESALVSDLNVLAQTNVKEGPPANQAGFSLEELVDRLLAQHMSRADMNFEDIFLCLYRRFAAPVELLVAIAQRFRDINDDLELHYLIKTCIQMRIVTVIAKWITTHPGDFAGSKTMRCIASFVQQLSNEPAFAAAAQEIEIQFKTHVNKNDDTFWARTDDDVELDFTELESTEFDEPSAMPNNATENLDVGNLTIDEKRRQSCDAQSTTSIETKSTTMSMARAYNDSDANELESTTLVPANLLPLGKIRYYAFLEISDDAFANELTRIDWVMFSAIRVRDFVRDVSLSATEKIKCKGLSNVKRMISHFNHIARWVTNVVLMCDKAKHRALLLEKFMRIALLLRRLNNYNGLAAIVAGINGSAINRLAQTRSLVTPSTQKDFMRLELLMGTQKSHFAYRLAWENSSLPRIPFIPLHRRDLVSAEEGSKTMLGIGLDRVNWRKFEVLAEILLPIMQSQRTPYPNLEKNDVAKDNILNYKLPADEEETYQRSVRVEAPSNGGFIDSGKRKFQWFQK